MRRALNALTAELKRLKASGVKSVSVSDETLVALRKVLASSKPSTVQQPAPTAVGGGAVLAVAEAPAVFVPPRAAAPTVVVEPKSDDSSIPAPPTVQMGAGTRAERWATVRHQVLNDPVCRSHVRPGKQVVFGVGSVDARIMFVGEAPGAEEEVQGEPFVGPAGQLLTKMIQGMALQRSDVYIGNIMSWRPEMPTPPGGVQYGNRPPTPREMAYCLPYLKAQIEIVEPAIIVALGLTAAQGLLGAKAVPTLREVRGKWQEFSGTPLLVTYHPSYILRDPTNRTKRLVWEDILKVMEKAELPVSEKQRGYFLEK